MPSLPGIELSGRRRRLSPDERRREIVAAATDVFAARPYEEVSLREIARAARSSRALVTHYFGDKRRLFLAVVERFADEAAATVTADPSLPPERLMAANLDAVMDFLARHRNTVGALVGAGPFGHDPALAAALDGLRDAIVERMLGNRFGDGEPPPAARFALRAYTGFCAVALSDWLRGDVTREEAHRLMLSTLRSVVAELAAEARRPR